MLQQSPSLCRGFNNGSITFLLQLKTTETAVRSSNIMLHNNLCVQACIAHMHNLAMAWQWLGTFVAASKGTVCVTAKREVHLGAAI